jgi:hypothetical protein
MDNPVYLDEDIPFVESGDYEIDEATGGGHGTTTTLSHGNIISLNHQTHQFHDDSMWTTNVPAKRGRRPKSATVVITTTEPKRRGRKPKQELLSPKKSLSSADNNNKSNDILSESTDDINQKQQRRSTTGMRLNKKPKLEDQQQQQITGKLMRKPFFHGTTIVHQAVLYPVWELNTLTYFFFIRRS